jgi:effector-binding domain-containing protein
MAKMSVLVVFAAGAIALGAQAAEVLEEAAPAEGELDVEVEIGEFGPMRVAFTEHTGTFDQIAVAIPALYAELGKQGITPLGAPMGIYYNDPQAVPEEKLRWEIAVPVPEKAEPAEPLKVKTIAKCTVVRAEYEGPADKTGDVYELLGFEALARDHVPVGPAMEVFKSQPKNGVIKCTVMFVVEKAPPLDVEIVEFGPQTIAYTAHTGGYGQIPAAIEELFKVLEAQQIEVGGPLMAIYLNDPVWTPEEDLKWQIAVPVSDLVDVTEPLEVKRIDKCTVARAAYKGPVDKLSRAYLALCGRALKRGYSPDGPAMELLGQPPENGVYECTIMFSVHKMDAAHEQQQAEDE